MLSTNRNIINKAKTGTNVEDINSVTSDTDADSDMDVVIDMQNGNPTLNITAGGSDYEYETNHHMEQDEDIDLSEQEDGSLKCSCPCHRSDKVEMDHDDHCKDCLKRLFKRLEKAIANYMPELNEID